MCYSRKETRQTPNRRDGRLGLVRQIAVCLLIFASQKGVLADSLRVGALAAQNNGEMIWSHLFTFDKGSRLTYRQDYRWGGLSAAYIGRNWAFGLVMAGTGGTVDSGGARDEDFRFFPWSEVRSNSLQRGPPWRATDSAHSIRSETYNFYDFKGPSRFGKGASPLASSELGMNMARISVRYFPAGIDEVGTPRLLAPFFALGVSRTFVKMAFGDGVQYGLEDRPPFADPYITNNRRLGIRHSFHGYEVPIGIGFVSRFRRLEFTGAVTASYAKATAMDIHDSLHQTNFALSGSGFSGSVALAFFLTETTALDVALVAHRVYLFGDGERGGFARGSPTFVPLFDTMHNLKQNEVVLGVYRIFETR